MKKLPILCILAGIALIVYLMFFPLGIDVKSMPEETLVDDTEETDDSFVDSVILEDIRIFLRSPRCSALHAAAEYENYLDSIELPNVGETLNDIRFAGWTDYDFYCNDYLRSFRRYMDTWLQGKKIDETEADPSVLEPYRERLRGKFFVRHVREFPFGGLLYRLISIGDPSLVLKVWIYSTIEDDGHIDEYQVQHIEVEKDLEEKMREHGITKDSARQKLLEITEELRANLW